MIQKSNFNYKNITLVRVIAIRIYYHPDYLGSTSLITNESGEVVEETFYDPYGAILEGGEESRYQYEGKEFSSVTNDYDYNFRKYNPEVGLFTQPEQLFPNIYDLQNLNRYRFVRNNPYKYVDNGKFAILIGPGFGGALSIRGYKGLYGSLGAGFVIAHDDTIPIVDAPLKGWDLGLYLNFGVGPGFGMKAGPSLDIGYDDPAKRVSNIRGSSNSIGGTVAYGGYDQPIKGSTTETAHITEPGVEAHYATFYTFTLSVRDLLDFARNIYLSLLYGNKQYYGDPSIKSIQSLNPTPMLTQYYGSGDTKNSESSSTSNNNQGYSEINYANIFFKTEDPFSNFLK